MSQVATYPRIWGHPLPAGLGFVAEFQRTLRDGHEYDRLFPAGRLERTDPIVMQRADTYDTVNYIAKFARQYQGDTAAVAKQLTGKSLEATCRNDWEFAFRHFQYKLDKEGVEQLRRPLRAWADRKSGIDCDCYTLLLSTILLNQGIAHKYRKTKYGGDWQHIYIIVEKPGGGYFTLDPVTDRFDKEVPFTAKFDKSMQPLQLLNGFGDVPVTTSPTVPLGSYRKFGFGAEFVGLAGEAEQVRQQALATIRTVSLQGLAAAASSNVVPSPEQVAELARVTGQSEEEAAADHMAVAHLSASFVERMRQTLINTGERIDVMPAGERPAQLVRLRGRINLLLNSWQDEAKRTQLFAALGELEETETRQAGLSGLGLGNIFESAWNGITQAASWVGNGISNAASSVGSGIAQAANWTYGNVIKPVGQAIAQAATWTANVVADAARAVAQGIKKAAIWIADEAVKLAKLIMKYNPLSILIRAGLRLVFRVNMFYISGRLGHGYFSESQARAKGLDMEEWNKCKSQLGKVISMWEGLQGDTAILSESILIGYQSGKQLKIADKPEGLAGPGLAGLGTLGDGGVVTGTSTIAASGFIATICTWLSKVDWGKLLGTAATVAEKLAANKQAASVPPITATTRLPANEAAYFANPQKFENQTSDSSSMLPIALGAAALGAYLFLPKDTF